jgi:chromate transporter
MRERPTPPAPTVREIFFTFLKITMLAFGGAIAWVHRSLVVEKQWLTEAEFAETLSLCQFLPGPNITNFAVVVGMRLNGIRGTLAALLALLVPPTFILIAVGAIYDKISGIAAVRGALTGLSAAAAGLFCVLLVKLAIVLLKMRPGITLPIAAASCAGVLSGAMSIPLALLTLGPISIAFAWFKRR